MIGLYVAFCFAAQHTSIVVTRKDSLAPFLIGFAPSYQQIGRSYSAFPPVVSRTANSFRRELFGIWDAALFKDLFSGTFALTCQKLRISKVVF